MHVVAYQLGVGGGGGRRPDSKMGRQASEHSSDGSEDGEGRLITKGLEMRLEKIVPSCESSPRLPSNLPN